MVLENRRALKLVVCMSLIVALAISALSLSVWASFENTHNNSGDQAVDIVGVAKTQVGYSESYDSYTKYGDWYGLPNSDWCAMFVSWCANQAGVDNSVFPSFALCSAGCDWFIKQGRFHYSGSYNPQAGDLIFYASYGNIYHVGLVTGSDGSNVYSIEGNYNDQVSNVSYSLGYGDILGYASPDYSSSNDSGVIPQEDSDDEVESDVIQNAVDSDSDIYLDTETEEILSDLDSEEPTTDSTAETDTEVIMESDIDSEIETSTDSESNVEVEVNTDTTSDTELDITTDTASDTEVDITTDTATDFDSEIDTDTALDTDVNEAYPILMGDVNGDNSVDSLDALMVQRYLLFDSKMDLDKADVNNSGNVDIGDAFIILKASVGLIKLN